MFMYLSAISLVSFEGGLKTHGRKTRDWKRSTKLQDWKTREKACMENQTVAVCQRELKS